MKPSRFPEPIDPNPLHRPMTEPLKTDLALSRREAGTQTSDRQGVDLLNARGDLLLADGRRNLAQALLNRLYTRRGALAQLGHPGYGSRLHQLIGEPDTRRTRALAEFYVREALTADPRVKEVAAVTFEKPDRTTLQRHVLAMHVTVIPVDGGAMTVTVATGVGG
jgi:phage baseplate assembly protein W